jgi:nucleotide-binding universal stress UspA family protein
VESHLERRRVSSTAFADGRAEAIEFHVAPDSPVCGRSLGELHAQSFVIGAILRGDSLIVPHGDTVLREDDLVTVVGAGADFAEIVRTFTGGEQRFPLGFGTRVVVALDGDAAIEGAFAEALHLVRNSRATSLLQVHQDPEVLRDPAQAGQVRALLKRAEALSAGVGLASRAIQGSPSRALGKLPGEESVGIIVIPAPRGHGLAALMAAVNAVSLARRAGRPVLLSRSTQPYRRILIPARRTPAGRAAIRAGIDLAKMSGSSLIAAIVSDPVFISGPGDPVADRSALSWVEEEAAVHGVQVESVVRRGNPVRQLVELGAEADLIVLGIAQTGRRFSQRERIAELVARRTDRSVLILPAAK